MKKNNIVLIGSGNVAAQLGPALLDAGFTIRQVYSRNFSSAKKLAKKLSAQPVSGFNKIITDADLYIVAVKDDAIRLVAAKLKRKNAVVVHTSGSVEMKELKNCSPHVGVLYPLQTFSPGRKISFGNVPLCIEAGDPGTARYIRSVAKKISGKVLLVNSTQRATLHLAAVFACNFSNHLYAIAEKKLKALKLSFSLLHPLILETALKAMAMGPRAAQTGPAIRGDRRILQKHLHLLKNDKKATLLYRLLSENILSLK